MRRGICAAAAAASLFCGLPPANAGTLIPIKPVAGSIATTATGMNDSNVITGYYQTDDGNVRGFVGTLDGDYTTFDCGKGEVTIPEAISNDGHITVWVPLRNGLERQLVRDPSGTFTPITIDEKGIKGAGRPGAILDDGSFVGSYEARRKNGTYKRIRGFLGNNADYQNQIVLPFRKLYGTYPQGLNQAGDIVGEYTPCNLCAYRGFYIGNGATREVNYPAQYLYGTVLSSINDSGMAAGYYYQYQGGEDSGGEGGPYAFLYDTQQKTFTPIPADFAYAINSAGLVVVTVNDQPYIYCPDSTESCPASGNAIHVSVERLSLSKERSSGAVRP